MSKCSVRMENNVLNT